MLYKFSDRVYYTKHRYMYLEPTIGYIKGDNYSIMIDTGNSKKQIEEFFDDLRKNNLPIPSYAILTHHHWDHTFGAAYINIPVVSSLKTKKYLIEMSNWKWDEFNIYERIKKNIETKYSADVMKKVYSNLSDISIRIPDLSKSGDFILNLGDIIVYFYANDNSHSDDALLVYVEDEKLLFLGDSHSKGYHTVPMSFDKVKLANYINFIKNINFEYAIPGHGNILKKDELISVLEDEYLKIK